MYNYTKLDPEKCEFIPIGPADQLPDGKRLFVEIDDLQVVVFNIADALFAIADVCSHDDGPLGDGDLEGFDVVCPRHGARFDMRDGKVTSLPAAIDIPAYPVREVDGQIEIGLPLEE